MDKLVARAYAVKFVLQNATEDMNEILREYHVAMSKRFVRDASIVTVEKRKLEFVPVPDYVGHFMVDGSPVHHCSRETRLAVLVALPMLWERLVVVNA